MYDVMTFSPTILGVTCCLIVRLQSESIPIVSAEVKAGWPKALGLERAALFQSLGNDALVESTRWSATNDALNQRTRALTQRIVAVAPEAAVEAHALALVRFTAGPGHRGEELTLQFESGSNRPVLVCVFDPIHRGRAALLQYLEEAGNRFATQLGGWVSAVVFSDNDRERVVEYLQFESMEAVGASQTSTIVRAHQAKLQTFGHFAANLYMVDAVFRP